MPYSLETQFVDLEHSDQHQAAVEPIYQSATFHQTSVNDLGEYDYTRGGNPTRTKLQTHLAKIMGNAAACYATNSGMGALDAICRLLAPSDEIIAGEDLYGGTSRLLTYLKNKQGHTVHHVDTRKVSAVTATLNANTKLVIVETPTNPAFQICDIPAVVKAIRASPYGDRVLVVVDNTMMSPINANPFKWGADIWYESATKYISGHHDVMAGVIAIQNEQLAKDIFHVVNMTGSALAPFDAWLVERGLKTMYLRFEKQQANAVIIANWLESIKPQIKLPKFEVLFPGLPSLPGYETYNRMAKGPGAVMSFRTYDVGVSSTIVDATQLFKISVSFGCVNSLISLPCKMSHASIDAKTRAERGFPEDIVRLCIGIESPDDLIEDLTIAFQKAGILTDVTTAVKNTSI